MKTGVTFITPPSPFLVDDRVFPSLGILKVAAVAERLGYPVEHLDLNGVTDYEDAVQRHCQQTDSQVFGITATTPQMPAATRIAARLRQTKPRCRVILGGPHPTVTVAAHRKELRRGVTGRARRHFLQMKESFDQIVAGDGENVIESILGGVEAGFCIDADDPNSSGFLSSKAWSATPLPARHLIDMESYHHVIDGKRVTSMVSQLGCPMSCRFCSGRDSGMLRRMRTRPAKDVLDEMRFVMTTYPWVEGFMFMDDEVNINKEMPELMRGIAKLQKEMGVTFANRAFVKAELFTQEQADLMREAGFRRILCGFESASPRILKNIQKNATVDDNYRMLQCAKRAGLETKALMSIGHPGESAGTVRNIIDWLIDAKPEDFDLTIITPYPGSPYFDDSVKVANNVWMFETNGDRLYMVDLDYAQVADYYKGKFGEYRSYVFTDALSADEIVELRDDGEREVRTTLGIPFYSGEARIEHSFGTLPQVLA